MFLLSDEKQQELGETKWRKEVQLYNKHGYNLGIFPGGFVRWVPAGALTVFICLSLISVEGGEGGLQRVLRHGDLQRQVRGGADKR